MVDAPGAGDPLRLLQRVATALSTGTPLAGLPAVAAALGALPGVRRAAVLALPEPRSPSLYLLASSDERELQRLPFDRAAFPAIAGAIEARQAAEGPFPEPCQRGVRPGDGPLLVLPLVAEGTPRGCLTLRLDPGRASPLPAPLLGTVAQLVALALGGGQVLEGLRDQTRKIVVGAPSRRDDAVPRGKAEPGEPGAAGDEALGPHGAGARYLDYFESAADGVLVLSADATLLHLNRAAEQLTGYARAGVRGRSLLDFVPPAQHEGLRAIVGRSAAGQPLRGFDFDILTTSGERLRVSASTSAALSQQGLAVFAFRDVTEARALEDELRKTKDFLLRLIDSAADGIVAADPSGQVILFNQGAARVLGWSPEEVIGHLSVERLYPEGMARQVMAELRDPRHGGRLAASRREVIDRTGERIPIELAASIVFEGGQEVATFGIFTDLRERLRIERSLAEAQERLQRSERQALIAELAGAAAHELNQPLTSVMGYAELLLKRVAAAGPPPVEGAAVEPGRRAAEIILREAERMAEIVRKIGRITRYESKPYVGSASILDLEKSAD